MSSIINKIPAWLRNKYTIAITVFLLFLVILDDNNIFYQYKLFKEQRKLQATTNDLKLKIKDLQKMTADLQKDPLTIEKIAREKYGMKKQNETVFLFPETK
jgi:cell division protein DivIC